MAQQQEGFKFYSERSKAKRALRDVFKIAENDVEKYMDKQDGKHGFTLRNGVPVMAHVSINDPALAEHPVAQANVASWTSVAPVHTTPEPQPEPEEPEVTNAPSASAFGAFALAQLGAQAEASAAAPAASTAQRVEGLKIDKDRTAANGVKERSKGGLCRMVWDELDGMVKANEGKIPAVADIKKVATERGWNVNNASIEYYQWRKFHGITGRGAKTL